METRLCQISINLTFLNCNHFESVNLLYTFTIYTREEVVYGS